jgi:hypothetical protein
VCQHCSSDICRKYGFKYSAPTFPFSLRPLFCLSSLYSVPYSLYLFRSFLSSFCFKFLRVYEFDRLVLFSLNYNVLTSRPTPQHVGQVIFKCSIYPAFISGLFCSAVTPIPLPPPPHEEVCCWLGWRPTAISTKANAMAAA